MSVANPFASGRPRLRPERLRAVRRGLFWWFSPPANAHMCITVCGDFTRARAYLERLAGQGSTPVSLTHLASAIVGRVLVEFPRVNARIIGRHLYLVPDVGLVLPVDLTGQPGARWGEVSLVVVPRVQEKSLRDLSLVTRGMVDEERNGAMSNPVMRVLARAADRLPATAAHGVFRGLHGATRVPPLARAFYGAFPVTSMVTNPGFAFRDEEAGLFRSAAITIPPRVAHLATIWGFSRVQDEVIAVEGRPEVRPMLPTMLAFDHRLMDGVMAGRVLARFGAILQDPEAVFGTDGELPIGR